MKLSLLVLLPALSLLIAALACGGGEDELLLGATTSVDDTGLLQELIDVFENESGYDVTPVVAGSGQILELAQRGELDVTLTHSPEDEARFVADGFGTESKPVMYNLFILVGPQDDPAGVSGEVRTADAFRRIAEAEETFVSRGDLSGTNVRELAIWSEAGIDPVGEGWYIESAVGQGQNLLFASDRQAYTLIDSATFAVFQDDVDLLRLLVDEVPNQYSATLVSPEVHDDVNVEGARAFVDFLLSEAAREIIASYRTEGYEDQLFFPVD